MALNIDLNIGHLSTASEMGMRKVYTLDGFSSSHDELNSFLGNSLQYRQLNEFGIPWGNGGREIIIDLIANQQNKDESCWCLWVQESSSYHIYPPAWAARGIRLERMKVAYSQQPIKQLREALASSHFKIIVFDLKHRLKPEEYCFLSQMAQSYGYILLLLQHYKLNSNLGNIWAKNRINIEYQPHKQAYYIESLKGPSRGSIHLTKQLLGRGESC